MLDEPNAVALETLAVIGERAGVQPSAIVRFAKAIGFDSASQMQKVIRDGLIAGSTVLGLQRARPPVQRTRCRAAMVGRPADVLSEFVEGNVLALNNLRRPSVQSRLICAPRSISSPMPKPFMSWASGALCPVSSYLAYSLQQVEQAHRVR